MAKKKTTRKRAKGTQASPHPNKQPTKKKEPPHTGSTSANFREGRRSEYLAHYVFGSFGTASPVHPAEDTGLDLHCTLTEHRGQRIWPVAYYSMQVKSDDEPWQFPAPDSVEWLVKNPLPLFFCIVDKKALRFRVYHTCARFLIWSLPPFPSSVELTPEPPGKGIGRYTTDHIHYSLGPPICDFSLAESLDEAHHAKLFRILKAWVDADERNLMYIRMGIPKCVIPLYETNVEAFTGSFETWLTQYPADQLDQILTNFIDPLEWFSGQLFLKDDMEGCLRAELLLRHLHKANFLTATARTFELHSALNAAFPKGGMRSHMFLGIDNLSGHLDAFTKDVIADARRRVEQNKPAS